MPKKLVRYNTQPGALEGVSTQGKGITQELSFTQTPHLQLQVLFGLRKAPVFNVCDCVVLPRREGQTCPMRWTQLLSGQPIPIQNDSHIQQGFQLGLDKGGENYTGKRPQTVWGVGSQCTRYKQR